MTFDEYQEKARTYRLPTADETYALLNLGAEVGEFLGKIAKAIRDQTKIEVDDLAKELGDIQWHLAALCDDLGITLGAVAEMNLDKLDSRKLRDQLMGSGDDR